MNEANGILGRTILKLVATETEEKDELRLTVELDGNRAEIYSAFQALSDELKLVLETVHAKKGYTFLSLK